MSTKHTPGPWKLVPNDRNIVAVNIKPHADGGYTWNEICNVSNADAALIAAAPEMLNALKHVLRDLEEAGVNADQPQLRVVQSAIDKAEGGLS